MLAENKGPNAGNFRSQMSHDEPGWNAQPSRIRRILLVDPDEPVSSLLLDALDGQEGLQLLITSSGREALSIARAQTVDIIITELMLQDISGSEICRCLKSDPLTSHIKVIVLTVLADRENRRQALDAGADLFFTKPVSLAALLGAIKQL